jgi:hypothetical protein
MQDSNNAFPEVNEFDNEIRKLLVQFEQNLKESSLPDEIFHYTNASGLKGIFDSGHLWLTDIFNLNDPSELKHGYSIFVDCFKERARHHTILAQRIAERFAQVHRDGSIRRAANFFVCSFSAHKNDLAQWRAYADDGRGFALGFDRKALEDGFLAAGRQAGQENPCFPITYSERDLEKISLELLDLACPMMSLSCSDDHYIGRVSVSLAQAVLRAVTLFKHQAYKHEQEYRFLQIYPLPPSGLKIRTRASSLVRYVEFDWCKAAPDALRKIVIGPAADTKNAERAVHDCIGECLTADAIKKVEIVHSEIPYRPS